jgi:hypothetical protein
VPAFEAFAVLPIVAPEASMVLPETPAFESEPNRADCGAITGTDYLSLAEREWYIAQCMSGTAQARLASVSPVSTTVQASAAVGGSTIELFIDGYRAAGGNEAYLDRIVTRVIPCESGGVPTIVNRSGPFYGLMQFSPSTWAATGGGDWFDPWQQGANTARLVAMANPAHHWPICWKR